MLAIIGLQPGLFLVTQLTQISINHKISLSQITTNKVIYFMLKNIIVLEVRGYNE
jgi:hypothetical protein